MQTDYGSDPLGNGKWKLIPSGEIVDRDGLKAWQQSRPKRDVQNDCLGLSWRQIEQKQGGKLKIK
jgi:hypothetical protein